MGNVDGARAFMRKALGNVARWWERGELGTNDREIVLRMADFVEIAESTFDVACGVRVEYDERTDTLVAVVTIDATEAARETLSVLPRVAAERELLRKG